MSVHFAISRTAASRAHPAWGLFVWVKSRSIIAACILLLDSGRKRAWGNRGLSAAVPKTMGFRPDGNQVERHGRTHSMASSSNSSSGRSHGGIRSRCFVSWIFRLLRGAWGAGLVIVGGVFVEMNDEFVFTMDTPTCRSKLLF